MLICRALLLAALAPTLQNGVGWPTHGGDSSHTGLSSTPAQPIEGVLWSSPLDLNPQYNGDVLYAHYGSPVVTANNVVVMPVKTGANGGFRIEGRDGASGALIFQEDSDYAVPAHNWYPTFGPTLALGFVAYPRKAGLVAFRATSPGRPGRDEPKPPPTTCFYGLANYSAAPSAYDGIRISSPLVSDNEGTVYFTYRAEGTNPLGLKGGLAVVRRGGSARYVEGATATGNPEFVQPKLNCAPAIRDSVVYAVFKKASGSEGVIVGLGARNLNPVYKATLLDPRNGGAAYVDDEGTSCPSIGEDGDVYFGVLENPFGSHHYRGWLLHFDATLTQRKTPGSFGWDDTPSLVPKAVVPGYTGTSPYLVLTKYNNYAGQGDGVNRVALLDPNASGPDPYSGVSTMKEVMTKVGPTPDAEFLGPFPNAVREWCVNTAAVDVANHAAFVNNEDGVLYRWNLDTNALDGSVRLNSGIGQAYTPTLIGPQGTVFAVSNARLYAVGRMVTTQIKSRRPALR